MRDLLKMILSFVGITIKSARHVKAEKLLVRVNEVLDFLEAKRVEVTSK